MFVVNTRQFFMALDSKMALWMVVYCTCAVMCALNATFVVGYAFHVPDCDVSMPSLLVAYACFYFMCMVALLMCKHNCLATEDAQLQAGCGLTIVWFILSVIGSIMVDLRNDHTPCWYPTDRPEQYRLTLAQAIVLWVVASVLVVGSITITVLGCLCRCLHESE